MLANLFIGLDVLCRHDTFNAILITTLPPFISIPLQYHERLALTHGKFIFTIRSEVIQHNRWITILRNFFLLLRMVIFLRGFRVTIFFRLRGRGYNFWFGCIEVNSFGSSASRTLRKIRARCR